MEKTLEMKKKENREIQIIVIVFISMCFIASAGFMISLDGFNNPIEEERICVTESKVESYDDGVLIKTTLYEKCNRVTYNTKENRQVLLDGGTN